MKKMKWLLFILAFVVLSGCAAMNTSPQILFTLSGKSSVTELDSQKGQAGWNLKLEVLLEGKNDLAKNKGD